jgi:hypothetical protein
MFADVVTIDAWHPAFSADTAVVDLHADVVFRVARLGAESDSPLRFRLGLKRAEVVAIIPPNEPIRILKDGVARDQSISKGRLRRNIDTIEKEQAGLTGIAKVSTKAVQAGLSAEGSLNYELTKKSHFESEQTVRLILVTQTKDAEGNYRWELEPASGQVLEGRGWEPPCFATISWIAMIAAASRSTTGLRLKNPAIF